jgi:hypothetical protein
MVQFQMKARPLTRDEAKAYITAHHRHHTFPAGYKFAIGAEKNDELVGVVLVGRPTARMLQAAEPLTCEVTRLCTAGERNVCSFLYAAARKAAFAMGFTRIVTYILVSEPGTSLKASGWTFVKVTGGGSWDRPSRKRVDKAPTVEKQLWEAVA